MKFAQVLLAAVVVVGPFHAIAQNSGIPAGAAIVSGVVRDEKNKPLARATVAFPSADTAVTTDSNGKFQIIGLGAGEHNVEVRAIGFAAVSEKFALTAGQKLEFDVDMVRASTLATRNVIGTTMRAEFDDRRARKHGIALDSTILNNRMDMFSAFSNLPLAQVAVTDSGLIMKLRTLGSRKRCEPMAYLDGKPAPFRELTQQPPSSYKAIEILPYETVPGKYFYKVGCGVVLFWSKSLKW